MCFNNLDISSRFLEQPIEIFETTFYWVGLVCLRNSLTFLHLTRTIKIWYELLPMHAFAFCGQVFPVTKIFCHVLSKQVVIIIETKTKGGIWIECATNVTRDMSWHEHIFEWNNYDERYVCILHDRSEKGVTYNLEPVQFQLNHSTTTRLNRRQPPCMWVWKTILIWCLKRNDYILVNTSKRSNSTVTSRPVFQERAQ